MTGAVGVAVVAVGVIELIASLSRPTSVTSSTEQGADPRTELLTRIPFVLAVLTRCEVICGYWLLVALFGGCPSLSRVTGFSVPIFLIQNPLELRRRRPRMGSQRSRTFGRAERNRLAETHASGNSGHQDVFPSSRTPSGTGVLTTTFLTEF